jgi:hypothetical protein
MLRKYTNIYGSQSTGRELEDTDASLIQIILILYLIAYFYSDIDFCNSAVPKLCCHGTLVFRELNIRVLPVKLSNCCLF